jgi:hypothetical protein
MCLRVCVSLSNKFQCFVFFPPSSPPPLLSHSVMEKPTVIGPNGLAPFTIEEQADFKLTTKVIYDVISNSKMISLEESIHAPAAVRNAARASRLATENMVSAQMAARRSVELGDSGDMPILYDASNGLNTKQLGNVCPTLPPIHTLIHTLTFPTACHLLSLTRCRCWFLFYSWILCIAVALQNKTLSLSYLCLILIFHRASIHVLSRLFLLPPLRLPNLPGPRKVLEDSAVALPITLPPRTSLLTKRLQILPSRLVLEASTQATIPLLVLSRTRRLSPSGMRSPLVPPRSREVLLPRPTS